MCGFAGQFAFPGQRADLDLAERMAAQLTHRGPDQEGSFLSSDGRCAIGFRRLAVIDPIASTQPMTSTDGRVTVAMNGEIYNFQQLRRELASHGAHFRTPGETEVLIHLYQRHGSALVHHLTGMFAFVIYDAAAPQLLAARDPLGQKPFWYSVLPDRIVFASEAKALLVHPGVETSLDMLSVQHFLSLGYVPAPGTIWRGVRKVLPGHIMRVTASAEDPAPYWTLPLPSVTPPSRFPVDRIRSEVCQCVEATMVSDVPLGALLSGGIDSSIVVAAMSRAAGRSGGVRTFTAGFEDTEYDERPQGRLVAKHCGTDHTEFLVRPAPREALDEVIQMYDEPFADSSALPTWLICRQARQHITVALTGDGGDEVFGGYDRYRAVQVGTEIGLGSYAALRLAGFLVRPWASHSERSRLRRLIRFADALALPPAVQYFRYRSLFSPDDLKRLLTEDFAEGKDLEATARWFYELYEQEDLADEVTRAQRHDLLTYLPDDLLVKTDIASMSCSLELRAGMLDVRLVELGLSLPLEMKVSRRAGKIALREAFKDMLPREILRRPKRGFGVPLAGWLRNELKDVLIDSLTDPKLLKMGIFRREAILGLINDHMSGRDDHSHRLWALLVLARWLVANR